MELEIRRHEPHSYHIHSILQNITREYKSPSYLAGIESGLRFWFNLLDGRNVPDLVQFVWNFIYNKDIDPIYYRPLFALAVDINVEHFMEIINNIPMK